MSLHRVEGDFDNKLFNNCSCAFGVFDGLHIGHRHLIEQAVKTRGTGQRAIAVTFDKDPDEVFHADRLRKLMSNADRLEALMATGVDDVAVLTFAPELFSQSPERFLQHTFGGSVPAHFHVGEDFRFGAKASGTVDDLKRWARPVGCEVHAHKLVSADGNPITATRIRKLLESRKVEEAARLLGRPWRLREVVQRGRGQGRDFGFATANLMVSQQDLAIGEGVYAAYAQIGEKRWKAAVSVGISPTFESAASANVEAHILDFEGDLVGSRMALDFIAYLRPMVKFETTGELVKTVKGNIDWVRANL